MSRLGIASAGSRDRGLARRQRARAHLERVRRGRRGPRFARWRAPLVVVAALAAGLAFGEGLLARLTGLRERPLERVAVRGARHLSPQQVAHAAALAPGLPLAGLEAVVRSLSAHEWIASARALRLPSGTLLLDVVEREPVARLTIAGTAWALDREGRPFAALAGDPPPELPEIVARGEVAPGEPDPRLARAVRLARRLPELGLAPPRQVEVGAEGDARGYTLQLAASETRVVLGSERLRERLDAFARLLALRPDDVAGAAEIDVRFADQLVLRGAPARDGSATTAPDRGRGPAPGGRPTG